MKLHNQGVITYTEANIQRIFAFVTGIDNHLHVNYWDGSQWKWADQGTHPSAALSGAPAVITYREGTQPQRIYAFVGGANGHLFVNYWDGSQWKWADQGAPPGTTMSGVPGVITYTEGNKQRIYAFVLGANGHLFVNYWDGSQWKWADQGVPSGITLSGAPGVITYTEANKQRIYAFVGGANGHLFVNYWDGSQWKWADQGAPPGTGMYGAPGVTTYQEGTQPQQIYAFVGGNNGNLFVNYWQGSQWKWADQSRPPAGIAGSPGVISYLEAGKQRIYAFVTNSETDVIPTTLNINYWDGSQWKWTIQGDNPSLLPAVTPYTPGVITYLEANKQRIYAFVGAFYEHLLVNYWDGSQWQWADQGTP